MNKNETKTAKKRNRKKIDKSSKGLKLQIILSIFVIIFIAASISLPWRSTTSIDGVILGTNPFSPRTIQYEDFGLFSFSYTYGPVPIEEDIKLITESYSPGSHVGNFFSIMLILVIATLVSAFALCVLLIIKYFKRMNWRAERYCIIPTILSIITLIYFVGFFPYLYIPYADGFMGYKELPGGEPGMDPSLIGINKVSYGPSMGWFLFLAAFIILAIILIITFLKSRSGTKKLKAR
jgi:hypothetical protein